MIKTRFIKIADDYVLRLNEDEVETLACALQYYYDQLEENVECYKATKKWKYKCDKQWLIQSLSNNMNVIGSIIVEMTKNGVHI